MINWEIESAMPKADSGSMCKVINPCVASLKQLEKDKSVR